MTARNSQPTVNRSTRSTRSTRMTTPNVQPEKQTVSKSTRKPSLSKIVKSKKERNNTKKKKDESVYISRQNSDGTMTRMSRWGSIREAQKAIRPAKTMLFMFVTIVIFSIAFGILYQNTSEYRSSSYEESPQIERSVEGGFEIIRQKRNTSTNTQILQQEQEME